MLRRLPLLFACFLLSSISLTAAAQDPVPLDEFSVMRFRPAPGPGNYLATDGATVGGHLVPSAGLTLEYAHEPFALRSATCTDGDATNCEAGDTIAELVEYYVAGHLHGALALADRVQIGLVVPLAVLSGESFSFSRSGGAEFEALIGGQSFALADPTLSVKARIFGEEGETGLAFAAAGFVTAPVGQLTAERRYAGEDTPTAGGHFIGELETHGVRVAANVGGVYRPTRTLFSTEVGSQVTYRLAVGYDVTPLVQVFGELDGASSFSAEVDENPLEARLAGRFQQGDFAFTLAGGAGVLSGVGVPVFRVLAGGRWAPVRGDSDGDGIEDAADSCPSEPEDLDGYLDEDGCPDEDNDGDGVADADDACPDASEDADGTDDGDGCPDADDDGDGIEDGYDSCPAEPEDMDGDRDEDGCPDNDTDRDGIEDADDQCPNEPEDTDGFGDLDGCPEEDFDGDGVPDDGDQCPDEPESLNGIDDEDGCPEEDGDADGVTDAYDECPGNAETINGVDDADGCPDAQALVSVDARRIFFPDSQPRFRPNGTVAPAARRHMDALLFALVRFPQFQQVRIEVAAQRPAIAERRANAIVQYLVDRGVAGERLTTSSAIGADDVVVHAIE